MKTLWTKPIDTITFGDVKAFVADPVRENEMVEYKKDFPREPLAKWLCAFANCNGGLLLLGVDNDPADREYPKDIPGIETAKATRNRIDQEAWKVIPPIPNLVECTDPLPVDGATGRCVLVVRVQASEADRGHSVDGITFVRTDGSSRPYLLPESKRVGIATIDEVRAIIRRREVAEEYRKQECGRYIAGDNRDHALIVPRFPSPFQANVTLHRLLEIARQKAALRLPYDWYIPDDDAETYRETWGVRFEGGVREGCLDVRKSGAIINSATGHPPYFKSVNDEVYLSLPLVVWRLVVTTAYAMQVYRHLDLSGQAVVHANVPDVMGKGVLVGGGPLYRVKMKVPRLSASMHIPVSVLAKDPFETLRPLITELFFPCGGDAKDDWAGKSIQEAKSALHISSRETGQVFFKDGNWTKEWTAQ